MTSSRQVFTIDNLDDRFATENLTGNLTASTFQSGVTFLISTDDTTTLTLPTPSIGLNYNIYIGVDLTNTLTIIPNGNWRATLRYIDKDTTSSSFNGISTTEGFVHYIGSNNYVADSDTKGRLEGTLLKIRCFTLNEWYVEGYITGNNAVGTPWA